MPGIVPHDAFAHGLVARTPFLHRQRQSGRQGFGHGRGIVGVNEQRVEEFLGRARELA
jgi:hypothetical protein